MLVGPMQRKHQNRAEDSVFKTRMKLSSVKLCNLSEDIQTQSVKPHGIPGGFSTGLIGGVQAFYHQNTFLNIGVEVESALRLGQLPDRLNAVIQQIRENAAQVSRFDGQLRRENGINGNRNAGIPAGLCFFGQYGIHDQIFAVPGTDLLSDLSVQKIQLAADGLRIPVFQQIIGSLQLVIQVVRI